MIRLDPTTTALVLIDLQKGVLGHRQPIRGVTLDYLDTTCRTLLQEYEGIAVGRAAK